MKEIILLEFKRAADYSESYYRDIRRVTEQQHTPIITGLWAVAADSGWEVEVVPLVTGQRSVKEKEWLESFRVFVIGKDDGQKIIQRLGLTPLREHEKLFGRYWRHTFCQSTAVAGERHFCPCLPASPGRVRVRGTTQQQGDSPVAVAS